MASPFTTWTVLPHKPVQKLEENLWYVEGRMGSIRRCMTVARLGDGRLVIHNAIALDEPEMKELEAWGKPAFLIVPNAAHRMDSRIYKQRYPELVVIAPPGAKTKVEEIVKVDRTDGDFGDPTVRYWAAPGTAGREGLLEVRSQRGVSIVINDLVGNQRHGHGLGGLVFRALGFTGPEPKVVALAKLLLVKDKPALKAELERLAATESLQRVIVSHGDIMDANPGAALRTAAASI